jgi:hypothetical protein
MNQLKRLAVVLLCLASPPAFAGNCALTAVAASQASLSYDPFQAGAATTTITVTIENQNSSACSGLFAFFKSSAPQASRSGGATLNYDVRTSNTNIVQYPVANPPSTLGSNANTAPFSISSGKSTQATVTLSVSPGQVVGPGSYTDTLTLAAYNGGTSLGPTTALNVSISVVAQATLSLAGAKSGAINFDPLVEGAVKSVNLTAYSNQGCKLTISSENSGVMKPTNAAALAEGWNIPYTVEIDSSGSFLSLSNQTTVSFSASPTLSIGRVIPVSVKVGSIAGKRAGIYKDVITIGIDPVP